MGMLNEHRDVGGWGCGHTRRLVVTHKRGAEVLLEISRDGSGFVDITDTVRASVSEMVCGSVVGPGVVFVFASSASQAIFVAEHPAASEFTKSLSSVTQNARAPPSRRTVLQFHFVMVNCFLSTGSACGSMMQ